MKRTYVGSQPAGWRWRWEKTVVQGKFCPCRKTARTYMIQRIDKSPVDDIDKVYSALFQSPSLGWERLKTSSWGLKPWYVLTDTFQGTYSRGTLLKHPFIEIKSRRCDICHYINICSALTLGACLLGKRCWGLIAVLRWDRSELRLTTVWPEDGWFEDRLLPLETTEMDQNRRWWMLTQKLNFPTGTKAEKMTALKKRLS